MASSATIPMAQSVAIPNKIVQISPTSSAPQLTDIKDNGYLWRAYPSDTLQGKVLAQAAIDAFGAGATLNVGARNDAFGTALKQLFVAQYEKLGGKVGKNVSWNPTQANFDTEAQQLVDGSPAGWVIIDFPETFEKFAPSLVRTGKWDAAKTFMTEALRNTEVLDKIGSPVVGLRGTAASAAGGPAGASFAAYWKKNVKGAKPYTGFEGTALDAANVAFLAALRACSSSPAKIKANLVRVSGPPGTKVTYAQLAKAIKLVRSGKEVDYEGAFSPVDFDAQGRHRLGRVRDLEVLGCGQDRQPQDGHVPGLMRQTYREGGGFEEAAAYSRAVRIGPHVAVSGTAAREGGDAYAQTAEALRRALAAAGELGAATRGCAANAPLLAHGCDWEGAVRAHREAFAGIDPANTTYFVSGFIPEGVLVEVELDAIVPEPPR